MTAKVVQKPYQWLAWFATACLLVSALLAAFNIHPWYVIAFTFSSSLWVVIGVLWREKSLIVLNSGLTLIYVLGLLL